MTFDRSKHPDLYEAIRDRLSNHGLPYVIENVLGAPYRQGLILCGSMFGMVVRRHRNFEASFLMFPPRQCAHIEQGRPITVTGHGGNNPRPHSWKGIHAKWPEYMMMPWATPDEVTQAIPPLYTEYIGERLLAELRARESAG